MVSPAPSTSTNPPLSYAERAKKAQNIKPRALSQLASPSNASVTSTQTIAPSADRAVPPATKPVTAPPPGPSHPPSVLEKPNVTASSSGSTSVQANSTRPPSPLSPPASRPNEPNGHQKYAPAPSSIPTSTTAPKTVSVPPVNVWNVRKEQMAQARALNQSRAPQPSASSLKSPQSVNQDPTPPAGVRSDVSDAVSQPAASSSTPPTGVTSQRVPGSATTGATNGPSSHANSNDDPFTVRPRTAQSSVAAVPPSMDDVESWPEVGKTPTAAVAPASADVKEKEESTQSESSEGRASRKSASSS